MTADLILHNGRFTTLDRSNPAATAVAITDRVFTAVGRERDAMRETDTLVVPDDVQEIATLFHATGVAVSRDRRRHQVGERRCRDRQ